MTSLFLILIGIILLMCIWLNNISSRIGIPTLLAFIVLGMFFGTSGMVPLHIEDYAFPKEICTVALIFIMFYGGFGTRWDTARPVVREAALLASLGVVLTAGLTGLFCHFALRWGWMESFLLGAVVSSTDAASVFSILRSKKLGLRNNTAPMLEMESGSNDPFSYMLTVLMLSLLNGNASGPGIFWMLLAQLIFGSACGVGIAKLAIWVMERFSIKGEGYDSLFILSVAVLSYALPDLLGGNGYLSAYIVGIMLGNSEFPGKKALVHFFDGITGLMQVLIFFLLGLLARPALLHKAILPALAIFAFMLLVARPLSVMGILTPFRKYPFRQQALVSFVGLRGASSIVFAIMAMTESPWMENDIFNIVFCLVLISISLQGSLIPRAARKLDMVDADADVMKTFNDYSEGTQMQFGSIDITPETSWNGRKVMDLGLPKNVLLALVLRNGERIVPCGDTILRAGDKVIVVTKTFEDTETYLVERTVRAGEKRDGRTIGETSGEGLVLLVRRNGDEMIPGGDTLLKAGDRLVILKAKSGVPYG
ncbi:MAG: potassium/proton antiporter [Bacteroidales bacterium]|nr:potassium/proton antiporter [Bacteroidales bacterium]MBR0299824.1 potassium/proton antiporter [Bacteroidales bacterium]